MTENLDTPEESTDVVETDFQTPMFSSVENVIHPLVIDGVTYLAGPYVVNRFMLRQTARSMFRITRDPLTGRKSIRHRKRDNRGKSEEGGL